MAMAKLGISVTFTEAMAMPYDDLLRELDSISIQERINEQIAKRTKQKQERSNGSIGQLG